MYLDELTDSVLDIFLTVMFVLLGLINVVTYIEWCNTNVYADLTSDKLKNEITSKEPSLEDLVLEAEDVVYMAKMKNNDYYMTCPTLALYLYAGDDTVGFKPHSDYSPYYLEPQQKLQWNSFVDSWIANNVKGKLQRSDKYRINQRLWRETDFPYIYGTGLTAVPVYPIECANTNDPNATDATARYNPMYGFTPTHYMDRYLAEDPNLHKLDYGYFYWTLEPYYGSE